MNRSGLAAAGLLALGLLQMTGELLDLSTLKGLGAATCASPAPKVFSAVQGLETFSSRFFVEYVDSSGKMQSIELTPSLYTRIRGPYNRRNAYGAVLAYGPILANNERTKPMLESVFTYALCGEAPLLKEIGIDPGEIQSPVRVRLLPRLGALIGELPLVIQVPCP